MKLQGVFSALTTPFDEDGELLGEKVIENVRKLNDVPLSGYAVCGSTGETPMLSLDERVHLMECVREASGDGKTLIAGLASDSVHESVRIANRAAELGYHFALALTPFYYRNHMGRPETQLRYYREVADRSKIPVLMYNMPGVSGYDLPVAIISELSRHPNIVGIKDSCGNLEKLKETLGAVESGFQVLSGSGANFGEAVEAGAAGAILAITNAVPRATVSAWEAFRSGRLEVAREWQARIVPFARAIAAKHGIPGIKSAMDMNGFYGGPPRLPFVRPGDEAREEISQVLQGLV
jgi:4-hydroxy-2-oxoglutarate aldolase